MSTYPTYKLGEICEIVYGKGFPTKGLKSEGFPVFGANGVIGFNDTYLYEESQVLISCRGAYSGKINLSPPKCWITNNSLVIKLVDSKIDRSFLYYALQAASKKDLVTGSAQPQVTINNANELLIPLPPLPTQHQIVSRIESLFAELDKAVEHLRTAQQQIKTYRQAVLNHWLNNDDGKWETVKLGEVAEVNTGSTPKRGIKDYWENGNIPWITSGEVNNVCITKASEYITEKAIKETNCKIIPKGSLVVAMYGEGKTRGKCAELLIDAATNQALASITINNPKVYKPYVKWFFERNYQKIRMLSSGGVQPNLNLSIIKNTTLSLPPLSEQQRIVEEIESRLSQAEAAETRIAESLQKTEALRQSILKKAFSGKLM